MLALSLRQPWAWLVVMGCKPIENRSWQPPPAIIGERIWIHASLRVDRDGIRFARGLGLVMPEPDGYIRGAVIGSVRVLGSVTEASSRWFMGPIGWLLDEPRPCEPVPCPGRLRLFRLPPDVERRLGP